MEFMNTKKQTIKLFEQFFYSILLVFYCHICSAENLIDTRNSLQDKKYFFIKINEEINQQYKQRPVLGKGIFLIAGQNLNDPRFKKTVILITNYDKTGTTGIIINKQSDIPVNYTIPYPDNPESTTKFFNIGGPVATNTLSLLVHTDTDLPAEQSRHIFSNVFLINRTELLEQLIIHEGNNRFFKLYIGYTGWASGQLESELLRGDWYIWHADVDNIFNKASGRIWQELIDLVTAKWVMR